MERVLDNFLKCSSNDIALMLILDGTFWTDCRISDLKNKTRTQTPKSYVVKSEEISGILKQYSK